MFGKIIIFLGAGENWRPSAAAEETQVVPRQLVGLKLGRSDAVPGRWWTNPDAQLPKRAGAVGKGQEEKRAGC